MRALILFLVLVLRLVPTCALVHHLGSRLPRLRVATTTRRLAGAPEEEDDDMAARIAEVEALRAELEAMKRPVERPLAAAAPVPGPAPATEAAEVPEAAAAVEVGDVDKNAASGGASSATSGGNFANVAPRPELTIDKLLSNAELFGR